MLATVRAALAEAEAAADPSADRVAQAISFGALMGARGKLGRDCLADLSRHGRWTWRQASIQRGGPGARLTQGTATAYKAVASRSKAPSSPSFARRRQPAVSAADAGGDLEDVLTAAVDGAHEAVAKTPSLLPILRDAGVVDAGGQGLYRLLQGTLRYLVSRASVPVVGRRFRGRYRGRYGDAGLVSGRAGRGSVCYETMFLLSHVARRWMYPACAKPWRRWVSRSWWPATRGRSRFTFHSGRPDAVIALGLSLGALTRITVENLDAQSHEVREEARCEVVGAPIEVHAKVARPEGRPHVDLANLTGLAVDVADAASAAASGRRQERPLERVEQIGQGAILPLAVCGRGRGRWAWRGFFESYRVAAVVNGGQSNNPSTGELLDAVEGVAAEEILLLPNNPNVVLAPARATEMTSRRVRVVPHT